MLTHVPFEDVPENYYVKDDDYEEDDYNFFRVEF